MDLDFKQEIEKAIREFEQTELVVAVKCSGTVSASRPTPCDLKATALVGEGLLRECSYEMDWSEERQRCVNVRRKYCV